MNSEKLQKNNLNKRKIALYFGTFLFVFFVSFGFANSASAALPAQDNFDRANATPAGGNWTGLPGTFSALAIVSNAIRSVSGDAMSYWNADTFSNDQYSQAVYNGTITGAYAYLSVRNSTTAQTGYYFRLQNGNIIGLRKQVAGTITTIGSSSSAAYGVGDVFKLTAVGNVITGYLNGIAVVTATDSAIASGSPGLGTYYYPGTVPYWDNWEGGNATRVPATFLEPGGDATFNVALKTAGGLWSSITGSPAIATDFVHGGHINSIKFTATQSWVVPPTGIISGAGGRLSFYLYVNALPSATASLLNLTDSGLSSVGIIRLTSAGVLVLWNNTAQIGSNGPTLSTGHWYRISLASTVTSTTVNQFELFVDGVSAVSVTNATLGFSAPTGMRVGNSSPNASLDFRISDVYVDNSNSLTDTGDIWVTAKRPVANGTTNGFTTQIGTGDSGYGSGHSPQVNERPLSVTNGWSIQSASKQTEEYTIETANAGDMDISSATIVDYMGWISAKVGSASTGNLIVTGVAIPTSITTTTTVFTKIAGSTTYPAGNTDIGMDTNTVNQLFSLYESGVIVAYIPAAGVKPTVTTQDATSVTATTAVLNGNITATGGANATVRGFAWGTSATMAGDTATTTDTAGQPFGNGTFTGNPGTLTCNTTYYSRAYATNTTGTGLGAISSSFTTSACQVAPTTALNTPADFSSSPNTTPTLNFTGTDANSDAVEYNVQINTTNNFAGATLSVGDSYGGGIVAYILQSGDPGYDASVQKGLIVATSDQSTGIAWITGGSTQTTTNGNTSTAIGTGQANTNFMIAQSGYTGGAAKVADDLVSGGYSDWYLPSKDELYKLYLNRVAIGGFASSNYWSSSENGAIDAWFSDFLYYGSQGGNYKNYTYYVRAVRSFTNDGPLLSKFSTTDTGFTAGHPFTSGVAKDFTVQAGDALTADTTYYWRVRAIDPSGSNTYGAWSSTYSFIVASKPTVTTASASSVTATSAVLNGEITATGGANATVRGFAWGTSATMAGDTATTTDTAGQPFGNGTFTGTPGTLTCNTTYYSRAYATNTAGTSFGAISSSFTTSACNSAPTVTTQSASSVTATGATLNGNITVAGVPSPTVRGFAWGTSATMAGDTATTTDTAGQPFGTGAFTGSPGTLTCNTTYYSRAYATNSAGTSLGAISSSFTTSACQVPPTTALNTPADTATGQSTTPTLNFTGTDANSDAVEYNVQINTTNNFAGATLSVGDSYGGGIVAYILQSGDPGYDASVQKGLIAATSGQQTGIRWYNGSYTTTGVTATTLGTGSANTTAIINSQGAVATSYAAGLARAYNGGGYSDWYLPSKDELNKLYINKTAIGGFVGSVYWSSSEYNANDAWGEFFFNGSQLNDGKGFSEIVRAVRSFTNGPLLSKFSTTDTGFTSGHPFTSGVAKDFTVQAGDALTPGTYYWRVQAIDPSGSNTYGAWSTTRSFTVAPTGITISGTVFGTDETTPISGTPAIRMSIGGAASTTVNLSSGLFSFTNVANPAAGSLVNLWTSGGSDRASLVFKYGTTCSGGNTNCTGLKLFKDSVIIGASYDNSTTTNADLAVCDNDTGTGCAGDTDIGYTSNGGVLTLTWPTNQLRIATSTAKFAPGGDVTVGGFKQTVGTFDGTGVGGTTGFGIEGSGAIISETGGDQAKVIVKDANYIYIGGYQGGGCVAGDNCWRVEKRDITTGALVNAFDSDGIVQSDPTSGTDIITSIAIDSSYIYLGGYQVTGSGCATGGNCWRVEKRDITTGALVTTFDSDGIVQSDPTNSTDIITSIAIDSSYIYLGGYQASGCVTGGACWRVEKHDITTGALVTTFDSDGIVQSDPTSDADYLNSIAIDSSYIYLGGYQASGCATGKYCWRVEKRDITTGALVNAFDSDGIVQSDPTSGYDVLNSIAIDSSYIYLGGYQDTGSGCATGGSCWRVEKRDITTGALVTTFDSDGIVQSDPTSGSDVINSIAIDSSYIYLGGYQATGTGCATGSYCWRVEKRDITTGALVTTFDSDGIVQPGPISGYDVINSIAIDSSYIYLGGYQATGSGCAAGGSCWRVEKRDITTGALVNAFDSDGIVQSDPTGVGFKSIQSVAKDANYIYTGGYQDTGTGCATGGYCWRVEKRDITTGALVNAFDSDGIVQSDPTSGYDYIQSIAIDSSYIYLGGYQDTGTGCATGGTCWRVEKRDITTGALVTTFDSDGIVQSDPTSSADQITSIAIDSLYIYLGGYQASGCATGSYCWRVEKRDITTGALVNAFDSDGIVQSDPTSSPDVLNSIATDSSYIYLGGYQSTGTGCAAGDKCWRVEKRDITTGALVTTFDSDGIAQSDPTSGYDNITSIAIDSSYIYLGGYQYTGSGCATGGNCWRVEKRNIITGALVTTFDSDGIAQSDPTSGYDYIQSIAIDSSYIYLGGYQATGTGCVTGDYCWRVEKRDITTGALVNVFDSDGIVQSDLTSSSDVITSVAIDSSYIYLGGYQNGVVSGRFEKRDITTGALVTGTGGTSASTLNINGNFSLAGGTFTSTTGSLKISGAVTGGGTFIPNNGTVEFTGALAQSLPAFSYYNLKVNKSSNTASLTNTEATIAGTLNLSAGTFDISTLPSFTLGNGLTISSGATLSAPTNLTVRGNFTNDGTFTSNNKTVTLDPTGPVTVGGTGSINFYNLTVNKPGAIIHFKADKTFGVSGFLNLQGTSGSPVILDSDVLGTYWKINFLGSANLSYVTIRDAGCGSGSQSISLNDTVNNGGHNDTCWQMLSRGSGGSAAVHFQGVDGDSGGGQTQTGGGQGGGSGATGGTDGGGTPPAPCTVNCGGGGEPSP